MESTVWNLAALTAFFVKGLCGFANTLVFTTVVSFSPAVNRNISPVELLLGYPTNLILAWRERRAIRWRVCLPLAGLVIAGSIPGALLLCGRPPFWFPLCCWAWGWASSAAGCSTSGG